MRVYQINVVCGSGSTGRIATDIAKMVEMQGGECRIAYGRGDAPSELDSYRIGTRIGIYVHVLMTRLTGRHGLYSCRATKRLIRDIQSYNPDIVHLHNIHGYYVNYEILFQYLSECRKPVVWTMHDCWAFTGHCAHYESANCAKWKNGCDASCVNVSEYPASKTTKHVGDNYRRKQHAFSGIDKLTIVTPSVWLAKQLNQSFFKDKNIITIPNGIDLNRFVPGDNGVKERIGCGEKKLVLGVTSVWTRKKGLYDFYELPKLLGDEYAVCLVGLSPNQISELPKDIIGIHKTDSIEELAQFYSGADVFLNLTYEDTFPTTNIEALACGTPVVTYQTGGSTEIITEHCGAVVDKGDLIRLKHVIEEMSKRPKPIVQCKEVASNYEKGECYMRYIELYQNIIRRMDK